MRFKDIIDKEIAINCRTEEEVKKLFECAKENGLKIFQSLDRLIFLWKDYKENTCYRFNSINDNYKIDWSYCKKSYYENEHYKIITLDDLEDFKDEIGDDILDVFEYSTGVDIMNFLKFNNDRFDSKFAFNKTKKKLYLKYRDKEIRVKCDEKDKFDWKIGLGLALYRVYQKQNDVKYMKKNYNYKKLAEYCLYKFYGFNENKIKELEDRVNNSKENTLIRL